MTPRVTPRRITIRQGVCVPFRMSFFPRNPIPDEDAKIVGAALQKGLVALIDLALLGKQAHWNVYGQQFLSVHLKLDDVVETARKGADTVAERMAQLGQSPDGRLPTLREQSPHETYPEGFVSVPRTLALVCDAILATDRVLRDGRKVIEEHDAPTDDLIQGILEPLEEHLWMLQAMEKGTEKGSE